MKSLYHYFIFYKIHKYNWYTDTQCQWWLANDQDLYEELIRGMSDIQDLKMS